MVLVRGAKTPTYQHLYVNQVRSPRRPPVRGGSAQRNVFLRHDRQLTMFSPQDGASSKTRIMDVVPLFSFDATARCMESVGGRSVWTADFDGSIRVRNATKGNELRILEGRDGCFCTCILHVKSSNAVWLSFSDGFVRVYDVVTYALLDEFTKHDKAVECMLELEGRVYTGGRDWQIFQWNPDTFTCERHFSGHNNAVRCMCSYIGETGAVLFSGGDDGTVRAWDPYPSQKVKEDNGNIHTFEGHSQGVLALALVATNNRLWSGGEDTTIRVWDLQTLSCVTVLEIHSAPVNCLAVIGSRVWSGDKHGKAFLWDVKTMTPIKDLSSYMTNSPMSLLSICQVKSVTSWRVWMACSGGNICCWNADANPLVFEGCGTGAELMDVGEAFHLVRENKALREELDRLNGYATRGGEDGTPQRFKGALATSRWRARSASYAYPTGQHPSRNGSRERQASYSAERENVGMRFLNSSSFSGEPPVQATATVRVNRENESQVVISTHERFFYGESWESVLKHNLDELRNVLGREGSFALDIPMEHLKLKELRIDDTGRGFFVTLEVRHSMGITNQEVDTMLREYPFVEVYELYGRCLAKKLILYGELPAADEDRSKKQTGTQQQADGLHKVQQDVDKLIRENKELQKKLAKAAEKASKISDEEKQNIVAYYEENKVRPRIVQLEKTAMEKEEKIKGLRKELEVARREMKSIQDASEKADNKGDGNVHSSPVKKVQNSQKRASSVGKDKQKLQDDLDAFRRENQILKDRLERVSGQFRGAANVKTHEERKILLKYEREDVKPRIKRLEEALSQKEKHIKNIENELDAAQREVKAMQEKSAKEKAALESEERQRTNTRQEDKQLTDYQKEKQKLQEETNRYKKECETLKEHLKTVKRKMNKLLSIHQKHNTNTSPISFEDSDAHRHHKQDEHEEEPGTLHRKANVTHEEREARNAGDAVNSKQHPEYEIQALKETLQKLQEAIKKKEDEATSLTKENEELRTNNNQLRNHNTSVLTQQKASYEHMLATYEEEDVKPRIEKLEHAVAQRDEALLAKEKLIKRLEKDLDSARHEARAARRDSTKSGSCSISKSEDAHMKELEALQQKVEALAQEKQRLQEEATHSRKECDVLKECLEEAKHSLSKQSHFDAEERRGILTAYEEEDVKPRIEKLEHAVAQRDEALLAKEKLIKRLEKDLDSARHEARAARRDSTKSGSSSVSKSEDAHMKELEALQQKVEALAQEKQRLQEEATHSRKECDVLKECLEEAKHSLSKQSHFDAEERRGILTAYEEEDVKPRIEKLEHAVAQRDEALLAKEKLIKRLEKDLDSARHEARAARRDSTKSGSSSVSKSEDAHMKELEALQQKVEALAQEKQRLQEEATHSRKECDVLKECLEEAKHSLSKQSHFDAEERRGILTAYEEEDVKPRIEKLEHAVAQRDEALLAKEKLIKRLEKDLDSARHEARAARRDSTKSGSSSISKSEDAHMKELEALQQKVEALAQEKQRLQEEATHSRKECDVLKECLEEAKHSLSKQSHFDAEDRRGILTAYEEEDVKPRIEKLEHAVAQRDEALLAKEKLIKRLEKDLDSARHEARAARRDSTKSGSSSVSKSEDAHMKELEALQQKVEALAQEKQRLQEEATHSRKECDVLKECLEEAKHSLSKQSHFDAEERRGILTAYEEEDVKPRIEKLEHAVAQRDEALLAKEKLIKRLEKDLDSARHEARAARRDSTKSGSSSVSKSEDAHMKELEALQQKVEALAQEKQRLQEEATHSRKECDVLKECLEEAKHSLSKQSHFDAEERRGILTAYEEEDVKPRIEKLEHAVAQRDEALLAKEKLIKRLEKDLDSARHEARAARRDSTKSGSSSISKSEDAHMKELEALQQKVEALAQEKQRLQEEATHSRKECDVLKECLEEAKHSLSKQSHFDAEDRRGILTAYEEEDVKPRIEKLEHAVAQRDEALLAKEKLIKRLEKDLDSARHEARAARRDSTKSGSSSVSKSEDAHMKELEALQQKVEALAQEKQRLQEEATHSRKECDVLKECLEEAKHSLSKQSHFDAEERRGILTAYEEEDVKPRIEKLEHAVAQRDEALLAKEKLIKRLEKDLDSARHEARAARRDSTKSGSSSISKSEDAHMKELEALQQKVEALAQEKQRLQEEATHSRKECDVLKECLEEAKHSLSKQSHFDAEDRRGILTAYEEEDVKPRIEKLEHAVAQRDEALLAKEKLIKRLEKDLDSARHEARAARRDSTKSGSRSISKSEDAHMKELEALQQKVEALAQEKQRLQEEATHSRKECDVLKECLEEAKHSLSKQSHFDAEERRGILTAYEEEDVKPRIEKLEHAVAQRDEALLAKEKLIKRLEKDLDSARHEARAARRDSTKSGSRSVSKSEDAHMKELEALQQKVEALAQEKQRLQEEATHSRKECDVLKECLEEAKHSLSKQSHFDAEERRGILTAYEEEDVKPRIEKLEHAVAQRDEALLAKEKLIKRLEKDLDSARHEARAARRDSTKSGSRSISKSEDAHMKELEALQQKVEALAQEKQRLQEEATHSRKECDVLKECLEEAKHSLSKQSHFDAEERRGILTAYEEEDVKPRIEKLEHAVAQRDEALLAKEKLIKRLEKDLDSARHEARAARRDSTKSGSRSISKSEDAHMKELEALQQKVEALAQEKRRLQEEATHSRKECDVLKECLEEAKHSPSKKLYFDAEERRRIVAAYEEEDVKPRIMLLKNILKEREEVLYCMENRIKLLEREVNFCRLELKAERKDVVRDCCPQDLVVPVEVSNDYGPLHSPHVVAESHKQRFSDAPCASGSWNTAVCGGDKEEMQLKRELSPAGEEKRSLLKFYEERDVKPRISLLERAVAERDRSLHTREEQIMMLKLWLDAARRDLQRDLVQRDTVSEELLTTLKDQLRSMEKENRRFQEETICFKRENDVLKQRLFDIERRIRRPSSFMESERQKVLCTYEEEHVRPRIARLERAVTQRDQTLHLKDEQIKELEKELNDLRLEGRQVCIDDTSNRTQFRDLDNALASEIIMIKEQMNTMAKEKLKMQDEVMCYRQENHALRERIAAINSKLKKCSIGDDVSYLKPKIMHLEQVVAQREQSLCSRDKKIEVLEKELEDIRRKVREAHDENVMNQAKAREKIEEKLQEEIQALQDRVGDMEMDRKRKEEEAISLKKDNEMLNNRIMELEASEGKLVIPLSASPNSVSTNREVLMTRLGTAIEQVHHVQREREAAERRVTVLQEDCRNLRMKLQSVSSYPSDFLSSRYHHSNQPRQLRSADESISMEQRPGGMTSFPDSTERLTDSVTTTPNKLSDCLAPFRGSSATTPSGIGNTGQQLSMEDESYVNMLSQHDEVSRRS